MEKEPRNITINIETLVGAIHTSSTNLKEGAAEIKKQVIEALSSAVNDSQLILDDSKITPTENGSSRSQSEIKEPLLDNPNHCVSLTLTIQFPLPKDANGKPCQETRKEFKKLLSKGLSGGTPMLGLE